MLWACGVLAPISASWQVSHLDAAVAADSMHGAFGSDVDRMYLAGGSCQETLSSWKSLRLLQFALPGDIVGGTTIRAPGSFKAHGMGGRNRHNFSQTMAVTSVRGSIIEAIENENTVYGLANLIGYLHGPRRCNET